MSDWQKIKEEHAQPNFMIGLGYADKYIDSLQFRLDKATSGLESVQLLGHLGTDNQGKMEAVVRDVLKELRE